MEANRTQQNKGKLERRLQYIEGRKDQGGGSEKHHSSSFTRKIGHFQIGGTQIGLR